MLTRHGISASVGPGVSAAAGVPQDMAKILVKLQAIGLGSLDQTVDRGIGQRTAGGIGEGPTFPPDSKGADGILDQYIADVQTTIVEITDQVIPLIQGFSIQRRTTSSSLSLNMAFRYSRPAVRRAEYLGDLPVRHTTRRTPMRCRPNRSPRSTVPAHAGDRADTTVL